MTEPFQNGFIRWIALSGGLFCLWHCVSCYRRQTVHWRFPFYSDIKRAEHPVLYWFLLALGLLLSLAGILAALFNVARVHLDL
jgi:hypothetical protein